MKISHEKLKKIVSEEVQQMVEEKEIDEGFFDKIKSGAKKFFSNDSSKEQPIIPNKADLGDPTTSQSQQPAPSPVKFTPPVEDATGKPVQQPAAQNQKLLKRMEIFKQNMPQYFQSIQNKLASMIKGIIGQNIQPIKEAIDPVAAISSLIGKEINNTLGSALKSITPEEFQAAYQSVAKKNIKDPKQLSQALKSFRGLEEQETVATNPLAGTELDLLDAVLQIKKIGVAGLIKQAVEKAVSNPQMKRFLPPEQAAKVIQAVTSSAKTVKQLLSKNPQTTAQTITKDKPAAQPAQQPAAQPAQKTGANKKSNKKPAPAQQPAPVAESYKTIYDKWHKIIKG